ncbi:MAG: DUF499 domain-containing protein [Ruminiclostridium sp.]|nr:DUF499 domain-containing protein [Ruminiclostridium sp.]
MAQNHIIVQEAFAKMLPFMAGYIGRELSRKYGDSWWDEVWDTLSDQRDDLPTGGDYSFLVDSLDVANCLRLIDRKWNDVFRIKLALDYRTWSKELMGVRNKVSHKGSEDFDENYTWRALDTIALLCEAFDDETAEEIRTMQRELRYGAAGGASEIKAAPAPVQTEVSGIISKVGSGLPSWRDIMQPHPDVAEGRYKHAEFAADLAQVARGEGSFEYRDPVEFFKRTYITDGMAGLLVQALQRITEQGGEPVIQLKTAFGGGKTHSMLALYHLLRANVQLDKISSVKPVLDRAGLNTLKKANIAVIVGTAVDPTKSRRPQNFPGITINTIWGEIAAQLAESSGNPKLYDYVKEADKKGVSPGSAALKEMLDACGPCLILMDELVAYAKKLYGVDGLPAGSFDNFITFIQEITEAARASKNSLVVASIPESDIEVGGEAGKIALESIEHTFGRMESIWKPVAANEGFEVVRRRLFLDCKDTEACEKVCSEFSNMYRSNKTDFPIEVSEVAYKDRMLSCYPIHPEVFDRLYNDWSTLEKFQRTRGVLRLMAAVIHELWMGADASPMIMPGSVPLAIQNVSYELTRYLDDNNWSAIIDSEIDGKNSAPYNLEKSQPRFGQTYAARRVARTVFLGSAPSARGQAIRGLEASRVRLGTIMPGENIPVFNDALNSLQSTLTYLYANSAGDRFWFDTRPTLRKTVEERASQYTDNDVIYEINERLKKERTDSRFSGLVKSPSSSLDVTDEQNVKLVILDPRSTYKASAGMKSPAFEKTLDIINNRGTSPRIYRNMIVFVAPDQDTIQSLKDGVRMYLAWKSVRDDSEELNLDATQNKETIKCLEKADETVRSRIGETYCWLISPYIDMQDDIKEIKWTASNIRGGNDSIAARAANKLEQDELLIKKWAPVMLKMELDNVLWKDSDSIPVKKLWDYLCTYCYLPRLMNYSVLEETILSGLNSPDYFGYAEGVSGDRFIGLKFNQFVGLVDISGYLVKPDIASKQLLDEMRSRGSEPAVPETTPPSPQVVVKPDPDKPVSETSPQINKQTHFFMSAKLDNTRINRDVQTFMQEIISHLSDEDDCNLEITLEVSASAQNGFSQPVVRTVSENCKTLKISNFGFEE